MAVEVRIQNFQSFEDCTVLIDGLTVITGTNNCGKTSVMRAIRGVFTNPPAGPLVRHGAAHLTVTLTFDDGTVIVWEKGWEKPEGKGKTINQYTINGTVLQTVGRGAPPEVEALGVQEIQAAADKVWPQIADQFDGTLFLINRPGSAVAEALSDVEKVGKLTRALKSADKDRRSAVSELKVRRKDKTAAQDEVDRYAGLDGVVAQTKSLSRASVQLPYNALTEAAALNKQYVTVRATAEALKGFDPSALPDPKQVQSVLSSRSSMIAAQKVAKQYLTAREAVAALEGFSAEVPDSTQVLRYKALLGVLRGFSNRLQGARSTVDALKGCKVPSFPDPLRASRLLEALNTVSALRDRRAKAATLLADQTSLEALSRMDAEEAEDLVRVTLGERGLCPTCKTVHEGGTHAENRP